MRAVLLMIVTMVLLFGETAEACRLRPGVPPSSIPPDLVAFAGVVEGDALPLELLKDKPAAPGLRVRVTEAAVSSRIGMVVDVYPLGHGSNCKPEPYDLGGLQASYGPGTKVSVVGWSESDVPGPPARVRTFDGGVQGVGIVPTAYPNTANGTLDFAAVAKSLRPQSAVYSSDEWRRRANAKSFQYYGFYKSLALLGSGLDESRKVSELENIRYYSDYDCLRYDNERYAYVALVRNARLSEPAQQHLLDGLPAAGNAGQPSSLKGTVFEGYCDER
jgi:hypothetical protein